MKLAVSVRAGDKGREVLSAVLSGMGTAYPQVEFRGHGGGVWVSQGGRVI